MAKGGRWGRPRTSKRKGTFDPDDTAHVKHTRVGVWDLYEEVNTNVQHIPGSSWLERAYEVYECMPYMLRMVRDILAVRSCVYILVAYGVVEVLSSLIPAASLWYVSLLLT